MRTAIISSSSESLVYEEEEFLGTLRGKMTSNTVRLFSFLVESAVGKVLVRRFVFIISFVHIDVHFVQVHQISFSSTTW